MKIQNSNININKIKIIFLPVFTFYQSVRVYIQHVKIEKTKHFIRLVCPFSIEIKSLNTFFWIGLNSLYNFF